MAYRSFWEDIIEVVYDAINSELNTQEEIDDIISDQFSIFSGYSDNAEDIPGDYKRRQAEFYDPTDLLRWLQDGGIPTSAIFVHRHPYGEEYKYTAYISPNS